MLHNHLKNYMNLYLILIIHVKSNGIIHTHTYACARTYTHYNIPDFATFVTLRYKLNK